MGATKKWIIQMHDEEYSALPQETRLKFISEKVVFDDYNDYKDDPTFQKLYKAKKNATKELDVWKFNQRHK